MIGKKSEGWKGVALTTVLCGVFLYWWFRPAGLQWDHEAPEKLVARAMAETPPSLEKEHWLLDFDLLETAVLQARLGMAPEGMVTAKLISQPVIQARTIRQLAQAHLNSDAERLGDALAMCDAIADPALRVSMRDEVLLQIAMLGFSDVVLPEAKTPLLRARLTRTLLETDGQETARKLLVECEAGLPSLPPGDAAPVSRELAWARVWLALEEGPAQAFPAIEAQPVGLQPDLWLDLFRVCCGRGDSAEADTAAVVARVKDPALVRKLELEALQSRVALRPADTLIAVLQNEVNTSPEGEPRIRALLALGDAHERATGAEAATPFLRDALARARKTGDPVLRANLLADIAPELADALLMEDATAALREAAGTARQIVAPDHRLPVLAHVMKEAFNGGEIQLAATLAGEAVTLTAAVPAPPPAATQELIGFLTRLGDWAAALEVIDRLPQAADRLGALDAMAQTAAEDCIGYDPSGPTPRGQPLDRIRELALKDEPAAAFLVRGEPAGPRRARAWLAMAKGLLLPPVPAESAPSDGIGMPLPEDPEAAGATDEAPLPGDPTVTPSDPPAR